MKYFSFLVLLVCASSVEAQTTYSFCSEGKAVRADLLQLANRASLPSKERMESLEDLLLKYPDDLFIHRQYQQIVFARGRKLEILRMMDRYRNLAASHPGSSQYQYLYARALVNSDTPKAIALLNESIAKSPNYPWPHLGLAAIRDSGRYSDEALLNDELDSFLRLCPETLEPEVWTIALRHAHPESNGKYVGLFRHSLEIETDGYHFELWPKLWDYAFKSSPPIKHEQVREEIGHDLQRLDTNHPGPRELWVMRQGYELLGNKDDLEEIDQRLLRSYPDSRQACQVVRARWFAEHPFPKSNDPAEKRTAYFRSLVEMTDSQIQGCPDWSIWRQRLMALSELPNPNSEQIATAGSGFIHAYHLDETVTLYPPAEFLVADVYLKKKLNTDQVSELIRQGQAAQAMRVMSSDRSTVSGGAADAELFLKVQTARLLTELADQLKRPDIASGAIAELEQASQHGSYFNNSYSKFSLWLIRAKYAEVEGHKLDALLMYRMASKYEVPNDPAGTKEVGDAEERLWRELGGSNATRNLWKQGDLSPTDAKDVDWTKLSVTMSPWTLSDLQGRIWKLESLKGKVVFVNIWATWCVPCQQELTNLQGLYERVKARSDIQVITFNVDEEVGKVAPFVQAKGYTFPVLFAKDYLNGLQIDSTIPRNWIFDPKGKGLLEHEGFEPDPQWESKMLDRLNTAKGTE